MKQVAFGLLLALALGGWACASEQKESEAPSAHRQAAQRGHSTRKPTAVAETSTARPGGDSAKEDQAETERENLSVQQTLAKAAEASAAAAVLTLLVLAFQAYLLGRTLRATERAADAAKDGADVARQSLVVAERPYVSVDNWAPLPAMFAGYKPSLLFQIINSGHTPATISKGVIGLLVADDVPETPEYSTESGGATLRPGGSYSIPVLATEPLTAEQAGLLNGGHLFIFIWGRMEYIDQFKGSHVTAFLTRYEANTKRFIAEQRPYYCETT